jgi:hypothetical protein
MPEELTTLRVSVSEPSADGPEIERITHRLRRELLDLEVEDVQPAVAGDAPAGAKGIELLQLGTLLVTLVKSGGMLSQVADLVRSWVTRNDSLQVSLEVGDAKLTVTGASAAERSQLIDAWIARALAEPAAAETANTTDDEAG